MQRKPRSDTRVFGQLAVLADTASNKTGLSRTTPSYTSVPPRSTGILDGSRSRLFSAYVSKTPHSLSSFATFRKLSVASATCSTAGARLLCWTSASFPVNANTMTKLSSSVDSRPPPHLPSGDRRFRTSGILQQSAKLQEAVRLSCRHCVLVCCSSSSPFFIRAPSLLTAPISFLFILCRALIVLIRPGASDILVSLLRSSLLPPPTPAVRLCGVPLLSPCSRCGFSHPPAPRYPRLFFLFSIVMCTPYTVGVGVYVCVCVSCPSVS